jgi:class 3 adenylate cyclase
VLTDGPIQVRMGLHTGQPLLDPPKYVGVDVHRAARIMSAGHGGQVLLFAASGSSPGRSSPDGASERLQLLFVAPVDPVLRLDPSTRTGR